MASSRSPKTPVKRRECWRLPSFPRNLRERQRLLPWRSEPARPKSASSRHKRNGCILHCPSERKLTEGHLEKLLSRSAAGTSEVNEYDSKREQSGINRGKLRRALRATAIFRGALKSPLADIPVPAQATQMHPNALVRMLPPFRFPKSTPRQTQDSQSARRFAPAHSLWDCRPRGCSPSGPPLRQRSSPTGRDAVGGSVKQTRADGLAE